MTAVPPLGHVAQAIATGTEQAAQLQRILDEEFEALRGQDLKAFQALQSTKESIIGALDRLVGDIARLTQSPEANAGGAAAAAANAIPATPAPAAARDWQGGWDALCEIMSGCRQAHQRNDILIRARLDTIRATLGVLQAGEQSALVDVYDRMGRIAGPRRGRGYSDV